ncbi:hypothetical protein [Actinoplanes xinjiangensis]|uniref:hypothetical protein n=1 Tax=Actinoplanes xinjiangensis TaxID=512350 RepID=UPI0034184872
MEIRLMGSQQQCTALAAVLQTTPGLHVTDVSRPYPNRHDPATVRLYLNASLTGSTRAGATVNTTTGTAARTRDLPARGDARA